MKVGALRHKVTLQAPVARQDDSGALIASWTDSATTRAAIEPIDGDEPFASQQVLAGVSHRATVRLSAATRDVVADYRLLYGARVFDIKAVLNVDERNRELGLLLTEQPRMPQADNLGRDCSLATTLADVGISLTAAHPAVVSLEATLEDVTTSLPATQGLRLNDMAIVLADVAADLDATPEYPLTLATTLADVSTGLNVSLNAGMATTISTVMPSLSASTAQPLAMATTLANVTTSLTAQPELPISIATTLAGVSTSLTASSVVNLSMATTLANVTTSLAAEQAYVQNRVDNAGTAYLRTDHMLTGQVDANSLTLSCWLRFDGGSGAARRVFDMRPVTGSARVELYRRSSGNDLVFQILDSAGHGLTAKVVKANCTSTTDGPNSDGWHHVFVQVGSDAHGIVTVYFDGVVVSGLNQAAFDSDMTGGMDFGSTRLDRCAICNGAASQSNIMDGRVADVWMAQTIVTLDKFINATTLAPVDLGADGSAPGVSPLVFVGGSMTAATGGSNGFGWTGSASDVVTQLGTGGNFISTSTFTDTT